MDARTNNSRKKIIQSGLKLFIQNEDSTLVDVAKRAEVGRATVYRQFKHKEALQEEIALYCLDRFDEVNMSVEIKLKTHWMLLGLYSKILCRYTRNSLFCKNSRRCFRKVKSFKFVYNSKITRYEN